MSSVYEGETTELGEEHLEEATDAVEQWLEESYGPQKVTEIADALASDKSWYAARDRHDVVRAIQYSDNVKLDISFNSEGRPEDAYTLKDTI